ncbi:MAG: uroporphyrinogen-III C-methyltransferase [Alphaproteobacteria bacterium]|nr:uroporphyrinogen-III C-methyltransferase [Alphaproteobacteria bacterium]
MKQEGIGEVWLVGAGPGDPDLLTLKAVRMMREAEVVLFDNLVEPQILELLNPLAERIYVGKRRGNHSVPQPEIGALLVEHARRGKNVLRLKGGDPFIFGRGGEEIEHLAEAGVPFQVCPGITAAIGCAAYAGIPLTHRDYAQSCVFITAQDREGQIELDWANLVRADRTLAVYMGLSCLSDLTKRLMVAGVAPEMPAAIIDNGTRPQQRVVTGTVANLADKVSAAGLKGPTIIIIGDVVRLREKLDWLIEQAQQSLEQKSE